MYPYKLYRVLVCFCFFFTLFSTSSLAGNDSLPSWNEGTSKQAIIDFVKGVTDKNSPDFVPAAERIAVFDNDGTLWSEHPAYFQLFFAMDRVKEMEAEHPEWKTTQPFQAVLEGDMKSLAQQVKRG